MKVSSIIDTAGDAVEKVGRNNNSTLVGIMLLVLVFLAFIMWIITSSQKEASDAYLASIESINNKVTVAIKENTAMLIEIRTMLYK